MNWKIEEAQQRFSELMGAVVSEPQLIYERDRMVAAFVEAKIHQLTLVTRNIKDFEDCNISLLNPFT